MKPSAGPACRKLRRGGRGSRRRHCLAGVYHTSTRMQPRDDLGAPYTSAPRSSRHFIQALHPGMVAVGSLQEPHIICSSTLSFKQSWHVVNPQHTLPPPIFLARYMMYFFIHLLSVSH